MLVLSRKLGERFQIGPDVCVTVVKLDRNVVRIGIEAPSGLEVYREELIAHPPSRTLPIRSRRPRRGPHLARRNWSDAA